MMATTEKDPRVVVKLKFGSLETTQRVFKYQEDSYVRKTISNMLESMMNQREKAYQATGMLDKYARNIERVRRFAESGHRWGFTNYVNAIIHIMPDLTRMYPSQRCAQYNEYRSRVQDLAAWVHQYIRKA